MLLDTTESFISATDFNQRSEETVHQRIGFCFAAGGTVVECFLVAVTGNLDEGGNSRGAVCHVLSRGLQYCRSFGHTVARRSNVAISGKTSGPRNGADAFNACSRCRSTGGEEHCDEVRDHTDRCGTVFIDRLGELCCAGVGSIVLRHGLCFGVGYILHVMNDVIVHAGNSIHTEHIPDLLGPAFVTASHHIEQVVSPVCPAFEALVCSTDEELADIVDLAVLCVCPLSKLLCTGELSVELIQLGVIAVEAVHLSKHLARVVAHCCQTTQALLKGIDVMSSCRSLIRSLIAVCVEALADRFGQGVDVLEQGIGSLLVEVLVHYILGDLVLTIVGVECICSGIFIRERAVAGPVLF